MILEQSSHATRRGLSPGRLTPGFHVLTKAPGLPIDADWVVRNVGTATGSVRLRLLWDGFVQVNGLIRVIAPGSARNLIVNWAIPVEDPPGLTYNLAIEVQQVAPSVLVITRHDFTVNT